MNFGIRGTRKVGDVVITLIRKRGCIHLKTHEWEELLHSFQEN